MSQVKITGFSGSTSLKDEQYQKEQISKPEAYFRAFSPSLYMYLIEGL